eukprot:jgi/Mesen1/7367/ME000381S06603
MAKSLYSSSSKQVQSSFHDVTLLEAPLLASGQEIVQGDEIQRAEKGPTVRILRFGFDARHEPSTRQWPDLFQECRAKGGQVSAWRVLTKVLPCAKWLAAYDVKRSLKGDVSAGLSVGFMLIPQGMAYARVAGLNSIYGLYTGYLPPIVYSLFGTSRQLAVGPTALVSLLVGEAIRHHADPESTDQAELDRYASLALLLALMCGTIQVAAGMVRLGWTVRFLSHAVVSGFSSGAAIIIGMTQMRYLLGFRFPRSDKFHIMLRDILLNLGKLHHPSIVMGCIAIAFLLTMKHYGKTYKRLRVLRTLGPILSVVISTLVISLSGNPWQIRTIGAIPVGQPSLFVGFPFGYADRLVVNALVVTGAAYLESISVAKTLAAKNAYIVDANQELVDALPRRHIAQKKCPLTDRPTDTWHDIGALRCAMVAAVAVAAAGLGLANVVGSLFSAYPTGGSFSRSAVNNDCGAKTGLAGMIAGMLMLATILYLTPLFEMLPLPILAAIVMSSVVGLVDHEEARFLLKVKEKDFIVWMLAFLGTLFFGIQVGVLVAIVISLGFVINESANAKCEILGRLPGTTVYRNVEQYPDAKTTPGIVVIRFHSHLYFANVAAFRESLRRYERRDNEAYQDGAMAAVVQYVIIDMTSVHAVDSAACHALMEVHQEYQARGVRLALANPSKSIVKALERAGIPDLFGRQWFFVRIYDAVQLCRAEMSRKVDTLSPPAQSTPASPLGGASSSGASTAAAFSSSHGLSTAGPREPRSIPLAGQKVNMMVKGSPVVSFGAHGGTLPMPSPPVNIMVRSPAHSILSQGPHSAPELDQSRHVVLDDLVDDGPEGDVRICERCQGYKTAPGREAPEHLLQHVLLGECICDIDDHERVSLISGNNSP